MLTYLMKQKISLNQTYLILTTLFSVVLVLTNIIGVKLFQGPFNPTVHALTTGIITYPITFLLTDVVSEIWGIKKANAMVVIGFLMSFVMLIFVQIAMYLPAHPYWVAPDNPFGFKTVNEYQNAFNSVFSVNGKLLFGSMLAYMVAQLLDVRLYHMWRRITKGKHLWIRNNGSTSISQLVDTFIVNSILFYWGFGWEFWQGISVMLTIYFYKLILAVLDTPLIYLSIAMIKKKFNLPDASTEYI